MPMQKQSRLCFRYTDSAIPLLLKIRNVKLLTSFFDCKGRFVSDVVGNLNCWFSHAKALTSFFDCKGRFVSDVVGNLNCWFSHAKAHFVLC